MAKYRILTCFFLLAGFIATCFSDFDGVAPLAWRWAQSSSFALSSVPVVKDGIIYLCVGTKVYGLDLETGNEVWHFPTTESIPGNFRTTPIYVDGEIIAANDQRSLFCMDAKTGHLKWTYDAADPLSGAPVLAGKFVVFETGSDGLMAVDTGSGKAIWANPQRIFDHIKGNIGTYEGDLLYFTESSDLFRMNIAAPKDTRRLARFSTIGADVTPTIDHGILYANTGSYVTAIDVNSGSEKWETNIGEDLMLGPAVSGDGVAVVTRDGNMIMLDRYGRLRKTIGDRTHPSVPLKIDLGSAAVATPVAVGKYFLVPTDGGSLEMIDPTTGNKVWNFIIRPMTAGFSLAQLASKGRAAAKSGETNAYMNQLSVSAAGTPVVAGDTLLVLAQDGSLLAFDKKNGVDLTGPDIRLGWPLAGAQVGSKDLGIVFAIYDEATGVDTKSLSIQINGQPVTFDYGTDGIAMVRFGETIDNKPLDDGRADIMVTASDYMGNTSTEHYYLYIDHSLTNAAAPVSTKKGSYGRGPGGGGGGGVGG